MCRKLFPLIALALILCLLNNAKAQLNIDFTQTGDPVQAGFEGYFADHEQAATFTAQSYSAFGTTVTVAPSWAQGAPRTAMQMIDRGGNDGTDTPDLLRDWIGTDNRGLGNPMTLTISGLPAGAYSWLSYHHDPTNQTGLFDVTVNNALGSTTTLGIDISATDSDNITVLADMTTFTATIASDGTNPVTFVFSAQVSAPTAEAFFLMNAFELSVSTIPSPIAISPTNGAADVDARVVLRWFPGDNTAAVNGHNLFVSGNFADVNDGSATAEIGILSDPAFDTAALPFALEYDTTYYWRVDEANVPGGPVNPGTVWNFTVEPISVPLAGELITATASSMNSADEGPQNTANGAGLDPNDLHSAELTDMWLSDAAAAGPAWIQYEFDKLTKLSQLIVWNHNTPLESAIGFGIKEATIEYSVDGDAWTTLGTTHQFARAPGAAGYAADTTIDFGGAAANYVRITPNSNWGGIVVQYGLSKVRFMTIPVYAREPKPASGTVGLDVDNVTLNWRAGREATEHNVYISTDEQAVADGTAPDVNVSTNSYDTGELDLGQTYFWKIVEVNPAEDPSAWEGDLWNFAMQEFLVVDDFEDYNDYPPDEIWSTWIDGYGNPANGATAGYPAPDFLAGEHYMETSIARGGQSMPVVYDNTGAALLSEVTVNPANLAIGPDWSGHSAKGLTLWFYGDPCNTETQMYVKVNGSQVLYDSDAENLLRKPWQLWYVDLTNFIGADLTNVTELAIGFEGGQQGTVLFDDIVLSGSERQLVTPVEPDPANLVAHYAFEGNTDNSTGAHSATVVGGPEFVAGQVGQAIKFDGARDYVLVEGSFDLPLYSAALWFRVEGGTDNRDLFSIYDDTTGGHGVLLEMTGGGTLRFLHRFPLGNSGGTSIYSNPTYDDGAWYHVTIVKSTDTMMLYINGELVNSAADATQFDQPLQRIAIGVLKDSNLIRYFPGAMDEVYFYGRVLSQAEIAWLAGRTKPFDKP